MKLIKIEEDKNVLRAIESCLKEKTYPLGSILNYGCNTTVIGYNHLFQYAKNKFKSYTFSIDLKLEE